MVPPAAGLKMRVTGGLPAQPAPLRARPLRNATGVCQARGPFSQGFEPRASLRAAANTAAVSTSQAYISHILNLSGLQGRSGAFQGGGPSKVVSVGGGASGGASDVSGSGGLDEESETARLQR